MLPTIAHALVETTLPDERVSPATHPLPHPLPHAQLTRQQQLRAHRICAPEHASYVRARCLTDPSVLPRWHQQDRGARNAHRGHHVYAPAGAYAGIPAWRSRLAFLAVAKVVLQESRALLAKHQVSLPQMLNYLTVRTGYVRDQRNGRRCIVRPKILASVLDCAENTVYRCQRVARALGLERVVMAGRMLTEAESRACRSRGSSQRGLSTEVAFSIPRRTAAAVDSVSPTSGSAATPKPHGYSPSNRAARGDKADAASPRPRRDGPGHSLARGLIVRIPWLRDESPGRCATSLTRFATSTAPWSVDDIVDALADLALQRGITSPLATERIRTRPAVVLAGLLRRLDPHADHPSAPAFRTLEPCGHPDCDGHGWIQLVDDAGRDLAVAKCPRCPAGLRSANADEFTNDRQGYPGGHNTLTGHGEPPF